MKVIKALFWIILIVVLLGLGIVVAGQMRLISKFADYIEPPPPPTVQIDIQELYETLMKRVPIMKDHITVEQLQQMVQASVEEQTGMLEGVVDQVTDVVEQATESLTEETQAPATPSDSDLDHDATPPASQ